MPGRDRYLDGLLAITLLGLFSAGIFLAHAVEAYRAR
jgi:hypothetical protein